MELRAIPPRKIEPNKYDLTETYEIPVKVLSINRQNQDGKIIPIMIERLDFNTGELVHCNAITFQSSLELFQSINLEPPFYTNCIVFKTNKEIKFKVVGIYSVGIIEILNDVTKYPEEKLFQIFQMQYHELNNWILNNKI